MQESSLVQAHADGITSATRLSPGAAYGRRLLLDAASLKQHRRPALVTYLALHHLGRYQPSTQLWRLGSEQRSGVKEEPKGRGTAA